MKIKKIRMLQRNAAARFNRAATEEERAAAQIDYDLALDAEDKRSTKKAVAWSEKKAEADLEAARAREPAAPVKRRRKISADNKCARQLMIEQRSWRTDATLAEAPIEKKGEMNFLAWMREETKNRGRPPSRDRDKNGRDGWRDWGVANGASRDNVDAWVKKHTLGNKLGAPNKSGK